MPLSLNFPTFEFQLRESNRKKMIFDVVRKKFVALTPEEWVRQHVIHYLVKHKKFSPSLLAIETGILFNGMSRRCDIVAYAHNKPYLLVECKAPGVPLSPKTIEQLARYQSVVQVNLLMITNGIQHLYLQRMDDGTIEKIDTLPEFTVMR